MTSTAMSSAANAPLASINAKAAATLMRRIHVPGIRLGRQCIEPAADLVRVLPLVMHKLLALAECRIVAGKPQCCAALHARARHVALDCGKFERQRGDRPRQPGKRLGLEA